ncbi:N-acetyltransferase [Vagococcus carniphilus]|uniref:N-acetyltransferase n=1 Tax=Vagococcus carniphilus TaxID=218144 RepID=A0AAW8U8R9_9ENTE|nr:N-acetyltransferase [Vagococcus carniphilus]MDT2829793.1 N-acetyltransferase [Vagococcus carniphilus]MDT2834207.1 N-acetyltransferase [Vagococcus carniphilus]MDT2839252.1 N-acetyltransferase [Vagococcus carniphilus]MDT2853311.1 N-acetyltransferase [Vagococcus carniphilus]
MIRIINENDYSAVEALTISSFSETEFGYQQEADLIKKIRKDPSYKAELELVDEVDGKIVGHGLLSECLIKNENDSWKGLALAPLSVLPSYQNKKIGTNLMLALEKQSLIADYPFIVILGHPAFYKRFGYLPASKWEIFPPFEVPEEFFMIKELRKNILQEISGEVTYLKAFE